MEVQKPAVAMKDKQLIMLWHKSRNWNKWHPSIQPYRLIGSIFLNLKGNRRESRAVTKWFQHEHVVLIFRLCCDFDELVICTLSSKPRGAKTLFASQDTMESAGLEHTVLLRSDGQAVACGCNSDGQCNIPPLDEGISYSQVSAGTSHTVLLRSDGQAVACGQNSDGRCSIPPLDEGLSYSQVSAGGSHTVLLRSDGQAVACGDNFAGQCGIPSLDEGPSYSQVCAGQSHTVLLRSDGQAVACGDNSIGQCNIPPLDEGLSYSQVSAGQMHTMLLRSDGQAVACGAHLVGQCSIPPLDEGLSYSQVSAGGWHTVFLRSDGEAVACGANLVGQCSIPPLDEGLSYSQVSAGGWHTVFLRSDGEAVACGVNSDGICSIPSLRSWREWLPFGFASPGYRYICDSTMLGKDRVVQVDFLIEGDAGVILTCVGLDGLEVLRLKAQKSDRTLDVCSRVARELKTDAGNLRMVLPDARLLGKICKANPFATLSDVISVWAKMASILWCRRSETSAKTNALGGVLTVKRWWTFTLWKGSVNFDNMTILPKSDMESWEDIGGGGCNFLSITEEFRNEQVVP